MGSALKRYFHTLRHLRLRQITYQFYYRLSGKLGENGARTQGQAKYQSAGRVPDLPPSGVDTLSGLPGRYAQSVFTFLNRSLEVSSPEDTEWNYAEFGKLWTYNLNYFEFLRQPELAAETGQRFIDSWISAESTHRDGWEPYPLSLRLVNWLQFYRIRGVVIPRRVIDSIGRQYDALSRKLEFHLGGNHLLENAIALALTARFLDDAKGRKRADQLLLEELEEQYLADGAHYERSIMYHLILLWRLLDLYSWIDSSESLAEQLRKSIASQLSWANLLITDDGRYPHFNDSTNGIAPGWSAVRAYANTLGLVAESRSSFPAQGAGYRHWAEGEVDIWMDVGNIGPDYIPGHAHADNLTFCIHEGGRPLVVDTSISTYEKNERRRRERSTSAHNTVVPEGKQNSSDVWGGFRVGDRAETFILSETVGILSARHNGFSGGHERTFVRQRKKLIVRDRITGQGTAYFHFDNHCQPTLKGEQLLLEGVKISWKRGEARLESYEQATGFNRWITATRLCVTFVGDLETYFEFN